MSLYLENIHANLFQWQSLITHNGPYDACKGVQLLITAVLGQIYGALSKVSLPPPYPFAFTNTKLEQGYTNNKSSLPTVGILLGSTLRDVGQRTLFPRESAFPERF